MSNNSSNFPERPVPPSFRYDLHIIHLVDKIGVKEAAAQLGISIDIIADHLNAARKGLLWAADDVNLIEGVNRLYERILALEYEIYLLKDENFNLKFLNDHLSSILRSEGKDPPTLESMPQLYFDLLRDDDNGDCDYLGFEDLGYEDWQQPRHYYDE